MIDIFDRAASMATDKLSSELDKRRSTLPDIILSTLNSIIKSNPFPPYKICIATTDLSNDICNFLDKQNMCNFIDFISTTNKDAIISWLINPKYSLFLIKNENDNDIPSNELSSFYNNKFYPYFIKALKDTVAQLKLALINIDINMAENIDVLKTLISSNIKFNDDLKELLFYCAENIEVLKSLIQDIKEISITSNTSNLTPQVVTPNIIIASKISNLEQYPPENVVSLNKYTTTSPPDYDTIKKLILEHVKELPRNTDYYLDIPSNYGVGYYTGLCFPSSAGRTLHILQHSRCHQEWWSLPTTFEKSASFMECSCFNYDENSSDIAICVRVNSNNLLPDVKNFIDSTKLSINRLLYLTLPDDSLFVKDCSHAYQLILEIKDILCQRTQNEKNLGKVHFFYSGPIGLTVMLGQESRFLNHAYWYEFNASADPHYSLSLYIDNGDIYNS